MSTPQLLNPDSLHLHDAIELPADSKRQVEGRSSRSDSYPMFVTRSQSPAGGDDFRGDRDAGFRVAAVALLQVGAVGAAGGTGGSDQPIRVMRSLLLEPLLGVARLALARGLGYRRGSRYPCSRNGSH